ncbi:hypothetical protein ACFXJ8_12110 [Nonomuraea sp. NPDC059194]|uniref:hypothetical protein n=1 Tax=Nonomuraea sp. NPDC059194 TaxID=3346764 RepID=UPI0036A1CEB9
MNKVAGIIAAMGMSHPAAAGTAMEPITPMPIITAPSLRFSSGLQGWSGVSGTSSGVVTPRASQPEIKI